MKSCLFLISLLFLVNCSPESSLRSLSSYVNPINRVRIDVVNQALYQLPLRQSVSMYDMIDAMIQQANNFALIPPEVVFMIYRWIGNNIEFDCYNNMYYPSQVPYIDYDVYNKGMGADLGITNLFNTMVKGFPFSSVSIEGWSKVQPMVQGTLPVNPDHIWNGVTFEGASYLIDMAWGMGSCYGPQFQREYSDFYFCTDPNIFIRSHLPRITQWQLLNPPKTINEFVNMLKLTKNFYVNGFQSVSPDKSTVNPTTSGKLTFTIIHDQMPKKFSIQLFYYYNDSWVEQGNACWIDQNPSSADMTCFANHKGTNKLYVYGANFETTPLPFLFEYDVVVNKNALNPKGVPELYSDFLAGRDFHLIDPIENPLKRSRPVKFRIRSNDFSNMYIINYDPTRNNRHHRELDYKAGGEFIGEDVYIFGKEVEIATRAADGGFNFIVRYYTIRDSTKAIDASFPYSYDAPKNILYAPQTDTLRIKQGYTFKIKCESCQRICVKDANNVVDLTKDKDSLFTGYVSIVGGGSQVEILNCDSNSCKTMYYYLLSY